MKRAQASRCWLPSSLNGETNQLVSGSGWRGGEESFCTSANELLAVALILECLISEFAVSGMGGGNFSFDLPITSSSPHSLVVFFLGNMEKASSAPHFPTLPRLVFTGNRLDDVKLDTSLIQPTTGNP